MEINKDYFSLTSTLGRLKYFLSQDNIVSHTLDRIKWHILPKLFITPRFPTHIDIETSSRCQLQCPMCGQRKMNASLRGIMSFDLYRKIIDECNLHHVYSIKLSWRGEPLLNPNLFKMVRYAKDKGIKDVAFLTNVVGFSDNRIQELINSGVDWISCSIDGLYGTYERIRYPAKFEETVNKIKKIVALRKDKPLIRVQTIFSAIKDNPTEYKNFWEPIVDKVNFIADQARQVNTNFPRDLNFVCPSPWQRMCIDYKGRVAQCHADYLEENILGDVTKQSLYEIWHGEPFKRVRYLQRTKRALQQSPCKNCCDRGKMESLTITVDGKERSILSYVGQG